MPLPLDDPKWNELRSSYGDTTDVVAWLNEAYANGGLSSERLGDLINEVQHQGDTSTAMYAVASHLVSLAQQAPPEAALTLLTHAGLIYAASDRPGGTNCQKFLQKEFADSAVPAAQMLAELLPLAMDFEMFKWAVAGLAGFIGHRSFARFLDGLELYQGQFHHALLSAPFPPEIPERKS